MRTHAPRAHGETRVRSEQFLGEGFGHVAALRYDRRNRPTRVGKQVANPGKALRMDFVKNAAPCQSYLKDFPEWNRQVSFYTIPGIGHDCLRAFADPHFIDFVLGL